MVCGLCCGASSAICRLSVNCFVVSGLWSGLPRVLCCLFSVVCGLWLLVLRSVSGELSLVCSTLSWSDVVMFCWAVCMGVLVCDCISVVCFVWWVVCFELWRVVCGEWLVDVRV